jgi:hypothetical protein
MKNQGSIPGRGKRLFSSPMHSDHLRDPPSNPCMCAEGCFPSGKARHPHLVSGLKMHWSLPPLPHFFMAWCLIKHRDNFVFALWTVCFLNFTWPYSSLVIYCVKKFVVWRIFIYKVRWLWRRKQILWSSQTRTCDKRSRDLDKDLNSDNQHQALQITNHNIQTNKNYDWKGHSFILPL